MKSKLYYVWVAMRQRCNNPKNKSYKNYGGRGIKYSKEFEKYSFFENWAFANGYKEGLTLDRINNNEGYSPENCRWANSKVQSNNKRTNIILEYNGESKTFSQWCEFYKVDYNRSKVRFENGYSFEETFDLIKFYDKRNKNIIKYKNRENTLSEWCKELSLDYNTTLKRIVKLKWSVEKAFEKESRNKIIEFNGEKGSLQYFCDKLNLNYSTVRSRINDGKWSVEKALTTPTRRKRNE